MYSHAMILRRGIENTSAVFAMCTLPPSLGPVGTGTLGTRIFSSYLTP